jgi:hypothetical protein
MMQRLAGILVVLAACLAALAAVTALAAGRLDRSWPVTVSPNPGDVSLVQIAFPHAGSARVSAATLVVRAPGVFGSDYLAVAAVRPALGGARALVLIANRPSPLNDPSRLALKVTARRVLGPPAVLGVQDVLARSGSASRPPLCDLSLHRAPLTAGGLSIIGGAGSALSGLGGAQALAQAYDIACDLPNPGTLREALSLPAGGGCIPCDAAPGYACPLVAAAPVICAGPVRSGLRAPAGPTH